MASLAYGEIRQNCTICIIAPLNRQLTNEDVHAPFIFHQRNQTSGAFLSIYSSCHGKTAAQWNVLSNNTGYRFAARRKDRRFSVIGENRETAKERSHDRMHLIAPNVHQTL